MKESWSAKRTEGVVEEEEDDDGVERGDWRTAGFTWGLSSSELV